MHKRNFVTKGRKTPSGPRDGRLISVNADEATGREPGGDFKGMATHSQRAVKVDPVRPDIQIIYALVQ